MGLKFNPFIPNDISILHLLDNPRFWIGGIFLPIFVAKFQIYCILFTFSNSKNRDRCPLIWVLDVKKYMGFFHVQRVNGVDLYNLHDYKRRCKLVCCESGELCIKPGSKLFET